MEDPRSAARTQRRDEKTLEQIWVLLVTGGTPGAPRPRDQFRRQLAAGDELLAALPADPAARKAAVERFVEDQRALLDPAVLRRAQRVAGVLVEPIQGEGGLRFASAAFFRRLRLLTRLYDVPLLFDEVQTGWGATGKLWAHEHFDLPCPPDAVMWAKKAQNGVLFVSEELATFFQEEKKFNTTWEGDSVGMLRLLGYPGPARPGAGAPHRRPGARGAGGALPRVQGADRRTSAAWAACWPSTWPGPTGATGCATARSATACCCCRPASGRSASTRATTWSRRPSRRRSSCCARRWSRCSAPLRRPGGGPAPRCGSAPSTSPPARCRWWTCSRRRGRLSGRRCTRWRRSGTAAGEGREPLLQYPPETLEATLGHVRAVGVGLRDRVSGRLVAYALGSPLENHDELGVRADPSYGDNDTLYLQAMAVSPQLKNEAEVEGLALDAFRARGEWAGYAAISTLIEARVKEAGPAWLQGAPVLEAVEDYLQSGTRFVYLRAPVGPSAGR